MPGSPTHLIRGYPQGHPQGPKLPKSMTFHVEPPSFQFPPPPISTGAGMSQDVSGIWRETEKYVTLRSLTSQGFSRERGAYGGLVGGIARWWGYRVLTEVAV